MNETLEFVIVTFVAAGALAVLVRPLFVRRQPTGKPTGCEHCASAPAGDRRP